MMKNIMEITEVLDISLNRAQKIILSKLVTPIVQAHLIPKMAGQEKIILHMIQMSHRTSSQPSEKDEMMQ